MQLQPTSLCISVLVFASKAEECSGVCVKAPLCALLEAAFLIRGHYMRLVLGGLQREARESAQIRPSRPIAIPMHLGNEIWPPPPQIPTFNSFPSSPCPWRIQREREPKERFRLKRNGFCFPFWSFWCVYEREKGMCPGDNRIIGGRSKWLITWNDPGTEKRANGER